MESTYKKISLSVLVGGIPPVWASLLRVTGRIAQENTVSRESSHKVPIRPGWSLKKDVVPGDVTDFEQKREPST